MEHQLSQGDCREEHKEEGEGKLTILIDGGCKNQRESTDGCSQIYVGDIEIIFQNVAASQISSKHENEDLVAVEEETRSTSPSPLELHELVQARRKKMRRFICKSLIFLKGP